MLNLANRVLGCLKLSKGGLTGTVVDLRILYGTALKAMASSIIIAYNHPSNNLTPSKEDQELTKKIKEAGEFLDINLLDHLFINTRGEYLSFANKGML